MTTKKSKIAYSEPAGYFPKSVRKELGLGEYAEKKTKTTKKAVKKKTTKSKK